ncbi:flagellar biosynthetic protein FliO [Mycoplana dimorpha]|uniref:Flagellar biosynthesis protein FliO n=1 Tax=Mycoplana dimorpha TaxID=28320 RepID=A0A2T5B8H3_MYCDI|nr:flagellar biosynthetic protein FliO [Mycoplana dimorpha]PTM95286.1 flagellar biosynthesis protein FliO [Mycoplana dimorpha]
MFEDIIAQYGTKFLVAAIAVLLGLACLALVLWIVRRRPASPFIRGGRNRQPRLSVLDAAAVDTRRRLVLVRRDDVEHLLMIGGPTDIVIESRILPSGVVAEQSQPHENPAQEATAVVAAAQPAMPPRPAEPAPPAAAAERSQPPVETRRPVPADSHLSAGISSMGHVLYGDDSAPARPAGQQAAPPPRPAAPPLVVAPTPDQPGIQASVVSERSAIDALDRARDRVLTSPVGTGSERISPQFTGRNGASVAPDLVPASQRPAADNPALVSEFERLLEAEIATAPPRPVSGPGGPGRTEPATLESHAEPPKSREETEAEMTRLLGELSASRKT